jgi:glycosyltransferase involved in cell wall biosynthesis
MKILLVADGRSPITYRWVESLHALKFDVHLISTFPCSPWEKAKLVGVLPVAFAGLAGSQLDSSPSGQKVGWRSRLSTLRSLLLWVRYRLGPLTIPMYSGRFRQMVEEVKPDLVHALRIPFEGMLAANTPHSYPLVLSTWGNDLTLHARGSALMVAATRRALRRADGLMSDTLRDLRLAGEWGFRESLPTLAVPGNGGLELAEFERLRHQFQSKQDQTRDEILIINPRGFRPASVHQDIFFQAIPQVLREYPQAHFICPAMRGQPQAERWVEKLKIAAHVELLSHLPQQELWGWFLRSKIYVSISSHDGTPNTLLEAMACGCLPVCGDIESIREWITNGKNGLLVDPSSAQGTAEAILCGIRNLELRQDAAKHNWDLLRERVDVSVVSKKIRDFYQTILRG